MKRKHSQLKRHPFVRLIRGILRLIRVIFKSKRSISTTSFERDARNIPQSDDNILDANFHQNTIQDIAPNRDDLITLGELLDGIKWQVPTADFQSKVPNPNRIDRVHDVSRNYK